ncbi:MAG: methylated-DNA--[protein]-cysteine S-methyltransferase [Vicinamibacterales bacterium]
MQQATHTTGTLALEQLDTPIGTLFIVTDTLGVVHAIDWADDAGPRLESRSWDSLPLPGRAGHSPARRALAKYFEGDVRAIDSLATATAGTWFQQATWRTLRRIRAGAPWTYGTLASEIGRPRAVRAAGRAAGANPIAIVVPCHRVIGARGALTGYRGGLARKRWLLRWEADVTRARLEHRAAADSLA